MEESPSLDTITLRAAARILKVHPRTMYRQVKSGTLPFDVVPFGKRLRIPMDSFTRYLAGKPVDDDRDVA